MNPWKDIRLEDYERHMKLDCVGQMPVLEEIIADQLQKYKVETLMILGVAGGVGLDLVPRDRFRNIYGLDINGDYLKECQKRYPHLRGIFQPIEADLADENLKVPKADLVIANLLLEFIGYEAFLRVIQKADPFFVSCVIQINKEQGFVSQSPYLPVFQRLSQVHCEIEAQTLMDMMNRLSYDLIDKKENFCPNGKQLIRLDYKKIGKE